MVITTLIGRTEWIEKNKNNLFDALTPSIKYLLLVLNKNKNFNNLNKKARILKISYSFLNSQMRLLVDLGLVIKEIRGRTSYYMVTKKGENFCEEIFHKLK